MRKAYSRQFRQQAVVLLQTSGRDTARLEKELGIGKGYLSRWKKEVGAQDERASPGLGGLLSNQERLRQMEYENNRLRQERDALEGALASQRAEALELGHEFEARPSRIAGAVAAGRLAAGLGHELKNSMSSVCLAVGNMREHVMSMQDLPGQKEILKKTERIEQELKHLAEIAMRLHSLFQEWEPEKEWAYLNEVVRNSHDLLHGTIERRGCAYQLNLDPSMDRPPQGSRGHPVYLNEFLIRQVMVNMTPNALDVSRRRQRVDYSTRLHGERKRAAIRIQDYGTGIDAETRPNLFKPFFTTKPGGTGLGLYICDLILRDERGGVLRLLTQGMTDREIAADLSISEKTARNHVAAILGNTGGEEPHAGSGDCTGGRAT